MNCKRDVREPGPWPHYSPCKRKAVTEAGYCKQHDPATVKARREKLDAKWKVKYEEKRRVRRIKEAGPDLLAALRGMVHFDETHDADYAAVVADALTAIAKAEGK